MPPHHGLRCRGAPQAPTQPPTPTLHSAAPQGGTGWGLTWPPRPKTTCLGGGTPTWSRVPGTSLEMDSPEPPPQFCTVGRELGLRWSSQSPSHWAPKETSENSRTPLHFTSLQVFPRMRNWENDFVSVFKFQRLFLRSALLSPAPMLCQRNMKQGTGWHWWEKAPAANLVKTRQI